jgi:hypothetical protein
VTCVLTDDLERKLLPTALPFVRRES